MDNFIRRKEIIRFISGVCSEREQKKIEAWMKESPENKKIVREYWKTWKFSENLMLEQDEDLAWQKFSQRISKPTHLVSIHRLNQEADTIEIKRGKFQTRPRFSKKIRFQNWLLRLAAVFLLTLCVLSILYVYDSNVDEASLMQPEMKEVIAGRGERMQVTFSDGTSVVLNSSSVVRFPARFDGDKRQVELEGEAFFSVARKEKMPFLVYTNGAVVQVLGTKFNVNAYPDDAEVGVLVADGKVAVRSDTNKNGRFDDKDNNEVILQKGEYTLVRQEGIPSVPKKVVMEPYLGWINGKLIFDSTPLEKVIKRLELYYDQDFAVSDSSLFDRRLTASFDKESFSKVLEILTVAMDLEYERSDSLVFLKPYI